MAEEGRGKQKEASKKKKKRRKKMKKKKKKKELVNSAGRQQEFWHVYSLVPLLELMIKRHVLLYGC